MRILHLHSVKSLKGFTIVELMVVLVIASILLLIGIPSFTQMIRNNSMTVSANEFVGAFRYARTEAIKRGTNIHLGQRNGTDWAGGIIVWVNNDGNNTFDVGDTALRLWEPLNNNQTVALTGGVNTFIIYDQLGAASSTQTFGLCDSRVGETGRAIAVLGGGAVSLANKNDCA